MSLDTFIPQIWSARLLQNLQNALVYGQAGVINRDDEGEIREVDNTVNIHSIGAVTMGYEIKRLEIDSFLTGLQACSTLFYLLALALTTTESTVESQDSTMQPPGVPVNGCRCEASHYFIDIVDFR